LDFDIHLVAVRIEEGDILFIEAGADAGEEDAWLESFHFGDRFDLASFGGVLLGDRCEAVSEVGCCAFHAVFCFVYFGLKLSVI
jgi:hypothetical protein